MTEIDRTLPSARRVLDFWINEIGEEGWYAGTPAIDAATRDNFLDAWIAAEEGGLGLWLTDAEGILAFLILTDQFPRNMFRGSGQSFATDDLALAAAKEAVARNVDLEIERPARQFFYLPYEHSEDLVDQDTCIALFEERMPDPEKILHAKAHRAIIARYGRFPHRNKALARMSTEEEALWLANGGYPATVEALRAGDAPYLP